MILRRRVLTTPVGEMLALASPDGLCALEFDAATRHRRLDARLARWFPPHTLEDGPSETIDAAARWLDAYFAGEALDPRSVPLDQRGAPFELRVWSALL